MVDFADPANEHGNRGSNDDALVMWLQHNSIVLVFAVFVLILLTTYWPGRKSQIERHGRIPLDDDR